MSQEPSGQRQRENMMQQRLRKARGEEIDEDYAYDHLPDADDDVPRTFSRATPVRRRSGGGGGCLAPLLYVIIGGLATLLVLALVFNQVGGIARFLPSMPNFSTIIITPTPVIQSGTAVVRRIQQLSRLETTRYTVEQVIDVRQESSIPWIGNWVASDALLLIAHGEVIAGIDLSQLSENAITISPDGRTITLQLPPAQILSAILDNSKTRVYSRDRGWLAPENNNLETLARQEAEQRILQAACEDGVLIRATEAAEVALQKFLGLLDYDQVLVVPSTPAACVVPSSTPGVTPAP
ncbi:DUF4230 domain-containing protein [Candidatus Oscillochloris fontis]|uniref:DUF4230 domain-containing protein n=1 Tax=Candidatus Oscillochloris fontis TaxID=2496868 RepID=UPI00101DDB3F|nr:DUF4230 domain-containing protein [Candidatus Oscillochloris fontis]